MGIKEMPRLARFIPKIMLAITVTACDEVYRKIACWLNDMGERAALRFRPCDPHCSPMDCSFIMDFVSPQKTIDSRVPMKKISSSKWF